MTRVRVLPGLEAAGYVRHRAHLDGQLWVEKNCYVDVIIEMLHALRLEPLAVLGSTAAIDFESDNFTFFKPNHEELRDAYGVDVQELNVWRPLLEHAVLHVGEGKFLSTEADSFWLPDTSGTDYRRNHVKSTIIIADVDPESQRLGYFHNAGYFELEGEDFRRTFRLEVVTEGTLPLFAELIRVDRVLRRPEGELAEWAQRRLSVHLSRRPRSNPIARFGAAFAAELPAMQERGLAHYHAWAFATTRQLGACAELLSLHLQWLGDALGDDRYREASGRIAKVSAAAKTFILKAARAVNARKPFEASETFAEMAADWDAGLAQVG